MFLKVIAQLGQPLLNIPFVHNTRRNHGLEHATVHLLARRKIALSGRSDTHGFFLVGEAPVAWVEEAAREALRRMQNGEAQLAVHPNCGTNLVTTGLLSSLVGWVGFSGSNRRSGWERLSWVVTAMMGATLVAQPLGMELQRHFTTDGVPDTLEIVSVTRSEKRTPWGAKLVLHRVETRF